MDCTLTITCGFREGKSYLKDVFVSPPFRVVPVGQLKKDGGAYLMITSSSPGILSGDHYHLNIQVEEHARLQLLSQSYLRLYNMDDHATQKLILHMQANASFSYVPHPIVPHENSNFIGSNSIFMDRNCDLLMGEIITCGRKNLGEIFKYRHFQNKIEIFYNGNLILKDNILLQPQVTPLDSIGGCLEEFTHQGTLIYINTKNIAVTVLIEEIFEMLNAELDLEFGISALQKDGFVIRVLGFGGEQIFDCFQKVQEKMWHLNTNNSIP